jgi:nitroreductase
MDIVESIKTRKSIRMFKPDPVPGEILREIIQIAQRAPSWANTQPWEFAVVSGKKLEEIRQSFIARTGEEPRLDVGRPRPFAEPFSSRMRSLVSRDAEKTMGIREGADINKWRPQQGSKLYGAPCIIYILIDKAMYMQDGDHLNVWSVFDCGLIAENIMLLAVKYGLGTIAAMQVAKYPELIREILGIPDSKLILIGIGIGYPDTEFPLNQVYSSRESFDSISRWYGFE